MASSADFPRISHEQKIKGYAVAHSLLPKNKVLELGSGREDSLQRNDECQAKEWRHIVMRQITARY
jgi:hypothetical protein